MNLIATARSHLLLELGRSAPRDPVLAAVQRQKLAKLRAELQFEKNRATFLRRWRAMGRPVLHPRAP
ncbi:hypothetical protein LJR220_001660 [Bradyrhizobium sp. LjRoot220]|uniref:hypothetical protein n=1 Tax=Bradyrhizobium sp. LjRoot220 TaxID=3342284 RepID=UPI003ECF117F